MTMTSSAAQQRRRIRYIDEQLQRSLLIGLVLLEAGLVAVLAWLMHRHLNRIVEENLYRAHLAAASPMFGQLMHEALFLLALFLIANVMALLIGEVIWRSHVNSVLQRFMSLIGKTGHLDFSADPEALDRHPLLILAKHQRTHERRRLAAIREQLMCLDKQLMEPSDFANLQIVVNDLKLLLPPAAAAGQAETPGAR